MEQQVWNHGRTERIWSIDTENCTFDKHTYTYKHVHANTCLKKKRFCFVCKFLIEIRAWKPNVDPTTICQLHDKYIKIQKLSNSGWRCINAGQTHTKQGISLNQHTEDCDWFTTVYSTCTWMVQLHWRLLQRRLQLVPTQALLCNCKKLLKM